MKTAELLVLIKNLSKAERKQFRLQATKQEAMDTSYMILYDELEKLADQWNQGNGKVAPTPSALEKKLVKRLSKREGFLKQAKSQTASSENVPTNSVNPRKIEDAIPSMKTYISRTIFKSLRHLHEKNSQRDEIDTYVKNARILENRNLLDLAANQLEIALKLALRHEYHALAYDILLNLIRIETQADFKSYSESINDRLHKLTEMKRFLESEAYHFVAYYKAFLQFRLSGIKIEKSSVEEDQPPYGEMPTPTFIAKVYHRQLISMQALFQGHTRQALEEGEMLLRSWEEVPQIKKERLGQYIRQVSNYLNFCVTERYFEHYEYYLEKLRSLQSQVTESIDLKAELEQNILLAEQLLCLNTDKLEEAREVFSRVEDALKKYGSKINRAREITLRYNNVIVLFALTDFKAALEQCLNMINLEQYAHRRDLQIMGKLFQIIIHYELKDHIYLEGMVEKFRHLFKKYDPNNRDFERMVLHNLLELAQIQVKKLWSHEEKKLTAQIFTRFHNQLLEYTDGPTAHRHFGIEEIIIWVKSKTEGKPFRGYLLAP